VGQIGNDGKENGNQRSQAPHGSGILPDEQLNWNGKGVLGCGILNPVKIMPFLCFASC